MNAVQKFESVFVHSILYKLKERIRFTHNEIGLMHNKTGYTHNTKGLVYDRKGWTLFMINE